MDPYRRLAEAIVLATVNEYRKALKRLCKYPKDTAAIAEKDNCEKFFHSNWYGMLTRVDGDLLIRKLQEEVQ